MAPLDHDLLTALDKMMRSDLDAWSSLWFWILVGSTIAVAIGIVAEAPEVWKEVGLGRETVAHIRKWWYIRVRRIDLNGWEKVCPELITKNDSRRKWIVKAAFIGWLLVAVGVAGEGIAEYFVNDAETGIRAFDEARLTEAMEQAGDAAKSAKTAHAEADAVKGIADEARADAKDALVKAQAAQRELAHAEADAAKAQTAASRALSTADKAESHLAEVVKRANELTEQLKRLTTPRSLTSIPQVVASLKPYEGTQYLWAGVCSDVECADLLKSIDAVLQQAGWKRLPSVSTYPALLVLGKDDPGGITVTLEVGIGITVEAPSSSELVAKQDFLHAPRHVQAAIVLDLDLAANVYPPEKRDKTPARLANVGEGTSTTVRITVGRKSVP